MKERTKSILLLIFSIFFIIYNGLAFLYSNDIPLKIISAIVFFMMFIIFFDSYLKLKYPKEDEKSRFVCKDCGEQLIKKEEGDYNVYFCKHCGT